MRNLFRQFFVFVLVLGLVAPVALASGGTRAPSRTPAAPETPRDPIAEAAQHYDTGLRNRDKAWKLEEQLAAAPEEDRAKLEKKIGKQYKRATGEFRLATSKNPQMFEAWSDLGYVLRKTGKYDDALVAYGNSLSLAPGYGKAIEYRAVAYLGLNRLDEAKESYIQLFGSDREEAAKWVGRKPM